MWLDSSKTGGAAKQQEEQKRVILGLQQLETPEELGFEHIGM
jgi:hypothetical protein